MKKKYVPILLLTTFCLLLLFLITKTNYLFGSNIDWLSQHITIPEYFRTQFYETGNLFPDFVDALGAGQNAYNLSYYGLFRLDVLISYALPFIDMKTIVTTYMIVCYIASVNLLYIWLKRHRIDEMIAIFVAILFACSTILFHSHRQIMFVNYMPFLILALLAIDNYHTKNKTALLIISIFFIITHSYYYSISAIIVCIAYYLYTLKQTKQAIFIKENIKSILIFGTCIASAILMAGILLIPTALVLLENSRLSSSSSLSELFEPNLSATGLLYQAYGCGLTFFVWLSLITGICFKKTRVISIVLVISIIFPFVSYILNGTLYARTKILIVLIPLLLYVVAHVLQQIKNKEKMRYPWIVVLSLVPLFFNKTSYLWFDAILSISIFCFFVVAKKTMSIYLVSAVAIVSCVFVNREEDYVSTTFYNELESEDKQELLAAIDKDSDGRFDDLSNPLSTSNKLELSHLKKTSIYSSINNALYNDFFYDVINNPISTRNNISITSSSNIFFQTLMNVRYVYTNSTPPIGYQEVASSEQGAVVQNDQVLPLAYATDKTMSINDFNDLNFPYTLDTLCNNVIVESDVTSTYQSQIQPISLDYQVKDKASTLQIDQKGSDYQVQASKTSSLQLALNKPEKIIIINFYLKDVITQKTSDTTITINGIKNKLSSLKATYPNDNYQFTYVLSSNEDIENLDIRFSKGEYTISNIETYTLDYNSINNRSNEVDPLLLNDCTKNQIVSGTIEVTNDGYFVTSIPYQNGLSAYVDGKEVPIEKVNTAFVGFPITKGDHTIILEFHAPGKTIGIYSSILGCIVLLVVFTIGKRQGGKNHGKD